MPRLSIPPRKRILVVEDDATIRAMLRRVLGRDYQVMVAADGRQALTLSRKAPPDLILLDVMLPGQDGFSIAEEIREDERVKHAEIIFLTARDTAEDSMRALGVGSKHYITKPFNVKDVMARVARILQSSQARDRLPSDQ